MNSISTRFALVMALLWPQFGLAQNSPSAIDYNALLRPPTSELVTPAYATVTGPRPFQFPADHGAHPGHRLEWWYITGNLAASNGDDNRRWGFQLTFFRFAIATDSGEQPRGWQSPQLYMGHFAVSDIANNRHYQFERASRAGAELAGVSVAPLTVWLDNWQLQARQHDRLWPATLNALATDPRFGTVSLTLSLDSEKPVVLQGQRGYSPKSARPGNASHYYSYTRLRAKGQLRVGQYQSPVQGKAWLDHEWSSSSLDEHQQGWDWFALQLNDGRDLMFYRLRQTSGHTDPYSRGVLVAANGDTTDIRPQDIKLQAIDHWHSPEGIEYPVRWRLRIPTAALDLTITAAIEEQAWRSRFRYWEGAVLVDGSQQGRGYMELTGYE